MKLRWKTYQGGANAEPLSGGTPTGYYLKKYCQTSINTTTAKPTTDNRHMDYISFR